MIYMVHTAPRTGGTLLCRHIAHKHNAINFDEWMMEMGWTQPGARKIPAIGWKPQEFPENITQEDKEDLLWFMDEMDKQEVAIREKSAYLTTLSEKYNCVLKMSSKNREKYLLSTPHVNIYHYRRDLLASACSWLIGILGLHVSNVDEEDIPVEHRAMPEYWGKKDYAMMHWTKEDWEKADTQIQKYDLSQGYAGQGAKFLIEPWLSSQWVWFNKALKANNAEFLVYEDWVENQEEFFPDSPQIKTVRTPVKYTEMLSDSTIEMIDEKIKDLKGAFKDNGFI